MKKDCNNTIEFLSELTRMCDNSNDCIDCEFYSTCMHHLQLFFCETDNDFHKEMVEKVQKWSDEHPAQTMQEKFFQLFPNAPRIETDYGIKPQGCPTDLGWLANCCNKCEECWKIPYTEVKE